VRRAAFALIVASALVACSSALPTPKMGAHENEEPIPVPFPPPPAHVEVIPDPPAAQKKKAVWVDGAWEWKGHRWIWQGGQWEVPEPNSMYAPPLTVRLADGSLAHFPGVWKFPKAPTP
jgi:hypothetical protein